MNFFKVSSTSQTLYSLKHELVKIAIKQVKSSLKRITFEIDKVFYLLYFVTMYVEDGHIYLIHLNVRLNHVQPFKFEVNDEFTSYW